MSSWRLLSVMESAIRRAGLQEWLPQQVASEGEQNLNRAFLRHMFIEGGMMEEQWKVINGYENYAVSSFGRIKRLTSRNNAVAGKILKTHIASTGYPMVNLLNENGRRHVLVYRRLPAPF